MITSAMPNCRDNHVVRRRLRTLAVAAAIPLISGCCCSSYVYDLKAYETWAKLEKGLYPPTKIDETGVSIQLPIFFDKTITNTLTTRGRFEPDSQQPSAEPFAVDGLQPPMFKLPGLKFTYEMFYPAGEGKKLPVYCYLAVLPPGAEEVNKAKDEIRAAVAEKYPEANWQPVTLEGSTFPAQRLSIGGTQAFFPKEADKPVEAAGKFDLYLVAAPHATVLVGFRAPQEIAEQLLMERAAQASVASIKSEKPAPPVGSGTPGTGATEATQSGRKVESNQLREIGLAYHN